MLSQTSRRLANREVASSASYTGPSMYIVGGADENPHSPPEWWVQTSIVRPAGAGTLYVFVETSFDDGFNWLTAVELAVAAGSGRADYAELLPATGPLVRVRTTGGPWSGEVWLACTEPHQTLEAA